ncbi:MAG: tetratricopeptide repeat protein [Candidatus Thorarchaeota archaeon]
MTKSNDKDDLIINITKFLEKFHINKDNQHKASILLSLAQNYFDLGKYKIAEKLTNKALIIYKKLKELDPVYLHSIAQTQVFLGDIYNILEDAQKAIESYREALQLFEQLGNLKGKSICLNSIGKINISQGEHQEALRLFEEALQIDDKLDDVNDAAIDLTNIALIHYLERNFNEALRVYEKALHYYEKLGDLSRKAVNLQNIALIFEEQGNYQEALKRYGNALEINDQLGDMKGEGLILRKMATSFKNNGNLNEAIEYSQRALSISSELGNKDDEASILSTLGSIYEEKANLDEALHYYEDSLYIYERIGRKDKGEDLENRIINIKRELSDVYFSVYAPTSISPNTDFILHIWAYLLEQKITMNQIARMEGDYKEKVVKGPITAEIGDTFTIILVLPAPIISLKKRDIITWKGKITNATFPISVPKDTPIGSHLCKAQIFVAGFIRLEIEFLLEIGETKTKLVDVTQEFHKIRKYFASYSKKDRIEVIKRVQGIETRGGVEVFIDCLSMCPGEEWEPKIYEEILQSDLLVLFWSLAAKKSKWVQKEWKFALEKRGKFFIQPFPLEDPDIAPPPEELEGLHFHHKYHYVIKGLESKRKRRGKN